MRTDYVFSFSASHTFFQVRFGDRDMICHNLSVFHLPILKNPDPGKISEKGVAQGEKISPTWSLGGKRRGKKALREGNEILMALRTSDSL